MGGTIFSRIGTTRCADQILTEFYGGVVKCIVLKVVVYSLILEVGCFIFGVFSSGEGR